VLTARSPASRRVCPSRVAVTGPVARGAVNTDVVRDAVPLIVSVVYSFSCCASVTARLAQERKMGSRARAESATAERRQVARTQHPDACRKVLRCAYVSRRELGCVVGRRKFGRISRENKKQVALRALSSAAAHRSRRGRNRRPTPDCKSWRPDRAGVRAGDGCATVSEAARPPWLTALVFPAFGMNVVRQCGTSAHALVAALKTLGGEVVISVRDDGFSASRFRAAL